MTRSAFGRAENLSLKTQNYLFRAYILLMKKEISFFPCRYRTLNYTRAAVEMSVPKLFCLVLQDTNVCYCISVERREHFFVLKIPQCLLRN